MRLLQNREPYPHHPITSRPMVRPVRTSFLVIESVNTLSADPVEKSREHPLQPAGAPPQLTGCPRRYVMDAASPPRGGPPEGTAAAPVILCVQAPHPIPGPTPENGVAPPSVGDRWTPDGGHPLPQSAGWRPWLPDLCGRGDPPWAQRQRTSPPNSAVLGVSDEHYDSRVKGMI